MIIQSQFISRLFGLHVFFAFFRKSIFDKFTAPISCTYNLSVYVKYFVHKFLQDLQSFHFAFKITISKMRNLCSRLLFHKNLFINRLLTSVLVLVNGIVFNRSNGLIIKCLTECLMN